MSERPVPVPQVQRPARRAPTRPSGRKPKVPNRRNKPDISNARLSAAGGTEFDGDEGAEAAAIDIQRVTRGWLVRRRFKKLAKTWRRRTKIAGEILSTEDTYVKQLRILIELYLQPLRFSVQTSPDPFVDEADISVIFSNVESLLGVNSELMRDLDEAMLDFNNHTTMLGTIFNEFAPFLKLYAQYCNNYDTAIARVEECRRNPKFQRFLKQAQQHPDSKELMLRDFLILPIQRIPRYKMLLDDLVGHTTDDHPDFPNLLEAQETIAVVARDTNESFRLVELSRKILEIQAAMTGIPDSLQIVAPSRRFIREGYLTKNRDKRWFFLFNDLLIYSVKSGTTYKYRNHLPLDTTWIKDVADNSLRDAFQIVTTGKTYTVQADSPADKAAWIADINAQIDALIEKDPTLVNKRKEAGSVRKSRGFFGRQSRDASGAGPSTSTAANTDSIALNGDDSDEAEFLTPLHLPDVPKVLMRNFGNPDKKGTLTKQGKRVASWKSRTVILKDKYLYYFKSTSGGSEPAGTIPLMHSEIKITEVEVKKKHCFQISYPGMPERRTWFVAAKSQSQMVEWMNALKDNRDLPFGKLALDGAPVIVSNLYWGSGSDSDLALKEQAAEMVARYAEDPLNHEALARWNVLGPLLSVLACGSPVAQAAACEALVYLSGNAVLKNDLADDDRLDAKRRLLARMGSRHREVLTWATWAVAFMTCDDAQARFEAANRDHGAIPAVVELLSATNDETARAKAGRVLGVLATDSFLRTKFREAGAIEPLIALLETGSNTVQLDVCHAIGFLCRNDKNRRGFSAAIPILVQMLTLDDEALLEQVCFAVKNLANDDDNRTLFKDNLALPKLISLLSSRTEAVQVEATECIRYFSTSDAGRESVLDAGGLTTLIDNLRSTNTDLQIQTSRALANLARTPTIVAAVRDYSGLEQLIDLLVTSPSANVKEQVTRALVSLTETDDRNREVICESGGLDAVIANMREGSTSGQLEQSSHVLANICMSDDGLQYVANAAGCPVLVAVISGPRTNFNTRKHCCKALRYLVESEGPRRVMDGARGTPRLEDIIAGDDPVYANHATVLAEQLGLEQELSRGAKRKTQFMRPAKPLPAEAVAGTAAPARTGSYLNNNAAPAKAARETNGTQRANGKAPEAAAAADDDGIVDADSDDGWVNADSDEAYSDGDYEVICELVAVYEFEGNAESELSFAVGDVIQLLERTDDEWWYGEMNGEEGYFPRQFTTEVK